MTINFILVRNKFFPNKAVPIESWEQVSYTCIPALGDQVVLNNGNRYDVKSRIFYRDYINIFIDPDQVYD